MTNNYRCCNVLLVLNNSVSNLTTLYPSNQNVKNLRIQTLTSNHPSTIPWPGKFALNSLTYKGPPSKNVTFLPCYPLNSLTSLLCYLVTMLPCYPLLPLVTLVTPCYPCYPCYPLLPLLPLVTLVTLVTPCYPLLPL